MHGVKRIRQSKEAIEAQRRKEQDKLKAYLALSDQVLEQKKNKAWTPEALQLTAKLLHENPEFYTVWNYRRKILLNGTLPNSTPEQINEQLSEDLSLTTIALKRNSKVYWIWNHRRWCLENVPDGPGSANQGDIHGWRKDYWNKEMFVVEQMLDADPRNFHAWAYRRYVLASMPVPRPEKSELAYTKKKISNFSNFSAWHQRSKVLSSLWDKQQLDPERSRESELELVRNGMYTNPADQSVWIYHRWLIGQGDNEEILRREIGVIQELLELEPESKWCMESLVHYNMLLLSKHDPAAEEVSATAETCLQFLDCLRTIDPQRRARYDEIETEVRAIPRPPL